MLVLPDLELVFFLDAMDWKKSSPSSSPNNEPEFLLLPVAVEDDFAGTVTEPSSSNRDLSLAELPLVVPKP